MIAQAWHPLCSLAPYTKGASMARKDLGETSQKSSRDDIMNPDDRVRGRADEMEDASRDEDSEDTDDEMDDDDAEEEGGSF